MTADDAATAREPTGVREPTGTAVAGSGPAGDRGPQLVIRTVEIEEPRPLLELLSDPSGFAWVREGEGFVATGEAARIEIPSGDDRSALGAERLAELAASADVVDEVDLPGTGLLAFGSLTFDVGSTGSLLTVPETVIGRRDGRTWLTIAGDPGRVRAPLPPPAALRAPDRVRYAGSTLPDVEWLAAVADVTARIGDGVLEKVVLARDRIVWDREDFDARVIVRRLAEHFPGCFTFLVDGLVGATPELLIRRVGPEVASIVLAGSARRDADATVDERIGADLLESEKDRREHTLAVDSVREILERACDELEVDPEPRLLRLENVQHLATYLQGSLSGSGEATTVLELAGGLHPTAAVGGTPRNEAVEMIARLERMDRGRYAGPVGWVDGRGDGEFGIALRCAELSGTRARLFAGAGVVTGSLPEAELEETRLKLRAMESVLEG